MEAKQKVWKRYEWMNTFIINDSRPEKCKKSEASGSLFDKARFYKLLLVFEGMTNKIEC